MGIIDNIQKAFSTADAIDTERTSGLSSTTGAYLDRIQSTGEVDMLGGKVYSSNLYDYPYTHALDPYKRFSPTESTFRDALRCFNTNVSDSIMIAIGNKIKKGDILSATASLSNVIASIYKSRLYDEPEVKVGAISDITEDWYKLTEEYIAIDQVLTGANYERVLLTIEDRGVAIKNINNVKEIISTMCSKPEGALELGMALLENYEYKR